MSVMTRAGAPTWVDLSTPDLQAATAFYRDLLGWTVEEHHSPTGTYVIGRVGDLDVGGMMAADDADEPAAWVVLFRVADVDASLQDIEQAGGVRLEGPIDLPDARLAIAADPTGAVFAVVGSAEPMATWVSDQHGSVAWVELLSRDTAAAIAFYHQVFGWEPDTRLYDDLPYTTFALGGDVVAGTMPMPDEVPAEVPSFWSVYFAVDDCAAAEARVAELGGEVLRPTMQTGEGRFAVVADPTGATFQLMDHHG